MHSNIAQGGGSQERVDDRVRERVGVGVSLETVALRDPHAAQDERPRGREAVAVEPNPDAMIHRASVRWLPWGLLLHS